MSSEKIKTLVNKRLDKIKESKSNRIKKLIDRTKDERCSGFIFKLFNKPIPSDEEILQELYGSYHGDSWNPSMIAWINKDYLLEESICSKLLHAAELAEEIFISVEDAQYL